MSKWVIITTRSPRIEELCKITHPNKQTYARLHNHEVITVTFSDEPEGYGLGFLEFLIRVRECLAGGWNVMQMDADAFFTNMSIKITDRIRPSDGVVIAREPFPNCPVNGGVVLLNAGERALAYVGLLIEHFADWKDDPLVPQGWMAKNMEDPVLKAVLRVVPPFLMNSLVEERPEFPHTEQGQVWKTGDWIAHPYGFSIERKIQFAKEIIFQP
jgi:hypothetical protein